MKPLANKKYKPEKFPGKGGWTFARIPEVMQDKTKPVGGVKARGTIHRYEINTYNLALRGGGILFLPVRAQIRKKIHKKEGDTVYVILYPDDEPLEVPEEMMLCLKDEPKALKFFQSLTEAEQKHYIDWIYSAKR